MMVNLSIPITHLCRDCAVLKVRSLEAPEIKSKIDRVSKECQIYSNCLTPMSKANR